MSDVGFLFRGRDVSPQTSAPEVFVPNVFVPKGRDASPQASVPQASVLTGRDGSPSRPLRKPRTRTATESGPYPQSVAEGRNAQGRDVSPQTSELERIVGRDASPQASAPNGRDGSPSRPRRKTQTRTATESGPYLPILPSHPILLFRPVHRLTSD
jgi:hypothetical protein